MNLRRNSSIKQASLMLVYLSLGIRALIPVGYMPAAIGDGWPVRACHNGLPQGLLDAPEGHHEASDEEHEALWEHCLFGVLSAVYSIENEYQFHIRDFQQDLVPTIDASRILAARASVFRSRGPPPSKR
jgi:hypothetical protein